MVVICIDIYTGDTVLPVHNIWRYNNDDNDNNHNNDDDDDDDDDDEAVHLS